MYILLLGTFALVLPKTLAMVYGLAVLTRHIVGEVEGKHHLWILTQGTLAGLALANSTLLHVSSPHFLERDHVFLQAMVGNVHQIRHGITIDVEIEVGSVTEERTCHFQQLGLGFGTMHHKTLRFLQDFAQYLHAAQ